jgi:hypothetical protein
MVSCLCKMNWLVPRIKRPWPISRYDRVINVEATITKFTSGVASATAKTRTGHFRNTARALLFGLSLLGYAGPVP